MLIPNSWYNFLIIKYLMKSRIIIYQANKITEIKILAILKFFVWMTKKFINNSKNIKLFFNWKTLTALKFSGYYIIKPSLNLFRFYFLYFENKHLQWNNV